MKTPCALQKYSRKENVHCSFSKLDAINGKYVYV